VFDLQRTIQLVTGALFDAQATWRSYLPDAGDWKRTAIQITVPVIVVAMIIAYLLGLVTGGGAIFGLRPSLVSTLIGIVAAIGGVALCGLVFSLLAGVFGGKNSFALGFAAVSLTFVPAYAGQALSSLPWIGWLLSLGLAIYSLVLLWRIIPLYLQVPDGKRAPHYIVSLIATIVASLVISAIFYRGQMPEQNSPFGNLPGAAESPSLSNIGSALGFVRLAYRPYSGHSQNNENTG
jgi:hypothetical protein